MQEGQKECESRSPTLAHTISQQSTATPQPVQDLAVPIPVSRVIVKVKHALFTLVHLHKAQIVDYTSFKNLRA